MTRYNKRTWLNEENSSFTGNVICCDTDCEDNQYLFVQISDCHNSIRLHSHIGEENDHSKFINKVKLLRDELDLFIKYLEYE